MIRHRRNPRAGARSGAAAAELAIILPVLLLLVLGAVDFGRFAYSYIAAHNAARAGAYHAATTPYTAGTEAAWKLEVQQMARREMTGQTGYVNSSLTVSTVETVETTRLRRVRVEVSYPFSTLLDWPGIPSDMTLRSAVVLRVIR